MRRRTYFQNFATLAARWILMILAGFLVLLTLFFAVANDLSPAFAWVTGFLAFATMVGVMTVSERK